MTVTCIELVVVVVVVMLRVGGGQVDSQEEHSDDSHLVWREMRDVQVDFYRFDHSAVSGSSIWIVFHDSSVFTF